MKRMTPVVLTMVLLLALSTVAGAEATSTSFTSEAVIEDVVDQGEVRETDGGVIIVRGQELSGTETITIDGEDFPGDLDLTINVNLDQDTGKGSMNGTWELNTPNLGHWSGTLQGNINDGLIQQGTFQGHGIEGTETKQRGTFTEVEKGVLKVEGQILDPAD